MDGLSPAIDDLALGYFLGLLVGEGHFGGDGRQPHITLRMHTRHEKLFVWLQQHFPGGALYGPYHHSGRHYFQWMARGVYLRRVIVPLISRHRSLLDDHAGGRFDAMCERYGIDLSGADSPLVPTAPPITAAPPRDGMPPPHNQ